MTLPSIVEIRCWDLHPDMSGPTRGQAEQALKVPGKVLRPTDRKTDTGKCVRLNRRGVKETRVDIYIACFSPSLLALL